jgi:hypothetical protein
VREFFNSKQEWWRPYIGIIAITELILWLATYFNEPGRRGQYVVTMSRAASSGSLPPEGGPKSPADGLQVQQALVGDTKAASDVQAGVQQAVHLPRGLGKDVLSSASVFSGAVLVRDVGTNGMVPPLWRPFIQSTYQLKAACSSNSGPAIAPRHLTEMYPEML